MDMDDPPYTNPEEDPFVRPPPQPRRRRSSMLDKWILEQQSFPSPSSAHNASDVSSNSSHLHPGLRGNPYLAYPDLGLAPAERTPCGSAASLGSYDLVEDEDIPIRDIPEVPLTPSSPSSTVQKGFLGTPSSFRGLHLTFRPSSPARSITPTAGTAPVTPSRKAFIPLSSRFNTSAGRSTPKQHNRSSSLSTLNNASSPPHHAPETTPTSSSKWRPSVMGYFSSSATSQMSSNPSEMAYTPSRPSVSSSNTTTTATSFSAVTSHTVTSATTATAMDHDEHAKTFKPLLGGVASLRSRRQSKGTALRSESTDTVDNTPAVRSSKRASVRVPFAPKSDSLLANSNVDPSRDDDEEEEALDSVPVVAKPGARPEIAFSKSGKGGSLSKVSFATLSSKNQKKKKLIFSGIAPNDHRKFDGVKRWCESFGEVTHIVRMPNGDLQVHFRSAEVADTVCRLRAKVYIAGVGSVNVSWATGNKR